ncbi:MAG: TrgA family protein [Cypionkella sp.]|uniref:TrgA family protein n=1 Tax=Cypionkella sp. TaxID=2811411 RepID=UPI002AB9D315|nr:TrgA family protein [Cypionkella sp.]MDZ4311499.1 TrgA family protein [Cypionkella sp.]MDZ4391715.1 TrgA family protein [Cypionkella sp.]
MPTASKLVAAIAYALLGFVAAQTFVKYLPEGTPLGYFREITAAIGFAVGWLVMGKLTRKGYREAINSGLVTALILVFWALLAFSVYFMLKKSTRMMYDGPMEAVVGIFQLMFDYGKMLVVPDMLGVILVGGVLAGLITEWAGKRWS